MVLKAMMRLCKKGPYPGYTSELLAVEVKRSGIPRPDAGKREADFTLF
jgi:hypothetical protein